MSIVPNDLKPYLINDAAADEALKSIKAAIQYYVSQRKNDKTLFEKEIYKWDLVRKWYKRDIKTVDDLKEWVTGKLYDPSTAKGCVNNLIFQDGYGNWQDGILDKKQPRGNNTELADAMNAIRIDNFAEIQTLAINNWVNKTGQKKKIDLRTVSTYLMCHQPFDVMQFKDSEFQKARKKWSLNFTVKSNGDGFLTWLDFAKNILLPLLAEEMNVNIAESFDFSKLDVENEVDSIRNGQYLCMLDVQDFVWMTFHSFNSVATNPMDLDFEILLKSSKQLIVTGAPGTGKTYAATKLAEKMTIDGGVWKKVQFHPGYDYSDFIIGLKPQVVGDQVSFDWKDGIFKDFANHALEEYKANGDNAKPYIFIIDEINRADLSRVFGEVFSLLEEEYRYPNKETGITLPNGENFILPDNLYIIGTMNDIDRSVESMDFALRRRFSWYEVTAQESESIVASVINGVEQTKLLAVMRTLNCHIGAENKPLNNICLNLGDEYQLGGAYFLNFTKYKGLNNPEELLWKNHIAIILNEYLRGRKEKEQLLRLLEKEFYDTWNN